MAGICLPTYYVGLEPVAYPVGILLEELVDKLCVQQDDEKRSKVDQKSLPAGAARGICHNALRKINAGKWIRYSV
jgi:hypothetical protein